MPVFPSEAWCRAVVEAVNADPATAEAGAGWRGDVACVVEGEAGVATFAFWCRPEGGRIGSFRVLEDEDEVDELAPAYVIRGGYAAWKGLIRGTLDPIEALVQRRMRFEGDVQQVIARARHGGLAGRVLERVTTTFPDEESPR